VTIPAPLEMYDLGISLDEGLVDMARIARVLADAGINIDAVRCTSFAPPTTCHFLVEHGENAWSILTAAGITAVTCRPVLVYTLPNRPGTLAHYTQALLSRGVAIDFLYQATAKGVVVGAADLDGVRDAFNAASTAA
jgi:hypothetical protein